MLVNKYVRDENFPHCYLYNGNAVPYKKSRYLRMLKEDCKTSNIVGEYIVPKGTLLDGLYPIRLTEKSKWNFEIKTTGSLFSGKAEDLIIYINEIMSIVKN